MSTANKAAKYELLTMRIESTLKAYESILKDYESDLKDYVNQDFDQVLIRVQETLIIKLKSKIELLIDLK